MPVYIVTRKSDGAEVYRYQADAPIEWDGMDFADNDHTEVVEQAVPVEPYAGSWRITRLAFRNRFTMTEKAAMELAKLDSPTATTAQRQQAAVLRAYMDDVAASTFVDLQRPDTQAGVQQLETMGLLAAGRAATILSTPPTDMEVFNG